MPSSEPRWTWSQSQSKALASCPRAFGFGLGYRGEGRQCLKLYAVPGIVIHDCIEKHVERWATGKEPRASVAITAAVDRIAYIQERRHDTILELRFGQDVSPRVFDLMKRTTRDRLERFFYRIWPIFRILKYETHEESKFFEVNGHKVNVKVDFAAWDDNDNLVIADWKTGGDENEYGGRLQLAVYATWAHIAYELPLTRIRPVLVSLRRGSVTWFDPTPTDVEYVRAVIDEDHAAWASLSADDPIPASPEREKCMSCMFLEKCREGLGIMAAEGE